MISHRSPTETDTSLNSSLISSRPPYPNPPPSRSWVSASWELAGRVARRPDLGDILRIGRSASPSNCRVRRHLRAKGGVAALDRHHLVQELDRVGGMGGAVRTRLLVARSTLQPLQERRIVAQPLIRGVGRAVFRIPIVRLFPNVTVAIAEALRQGDERLHPIGVWSDDGSCTATGEA